MGQKIPGMLCNALVPAPGNAVNLMEVDIDPQYFNFQTCSCESSYLAKTSSHAPQLRQVWHALSETDGLHGT